MLEQRIRVIAKNTDRELVWMKVRWLGEEEVDVSDYDHGYITTVLLTVDNKGRREGDTSVRGMVGTDEGRLVPGVYMWDIVAIYSRVPGWYNLRLRNKNDEY